MSFRRLAAIGAAGLLGACMAAPPKETAPPLAAGCPVLGSRSWAARLETASGPGSSGATLVITGEVDLPTPGYKLTMTDGPADRMMPPSQRFRLTATPPSGMVAQVVTSSPVEYRGKAFSQSYRSVIVLCGERALATIADVAFQR